MLRKISISIRLLLPILLMFVFALVVLLIFVNSIRKVQTFSFQKTEDVMLAGQKEKIKSAIQTITVGVSAVISDIPGPAEKEEMIRKILNGIRFDDDKSGYYFAYKGTVCVALPTLPERVGKDLANLKDQDGVYFVR